MDLIELRKIITLVEKSQIQELELEEEGRRIRISKASVDSAPANPLPTMIPIPSAPAVGVSLPAAPEPQAPAEKAKPPADNGTFVVAPMIGTFYRAPAPEAPPFVQVGDNVSADTVVCIVEAMKVMNEIKAGMNGKIVDVLVENAQPVEFGQPLFRVATD